MSVPVKVQPLGVAVLKVTLKATVPAVRAVLAGRVGLGAEDVMPTVSVTVLTTFQFASTAFTVTLNAVPAVCALGAPLLPVAVPGAEVSPGARTWSFENAPALTGIAGLLLPVIATCVTSEAVAVALPAVLSVTLKAFVPPTKAALAGKLAALSLELIAML